MLNALRNWTRKLTSTALPGQQSNQSQDFGKPGREQRAQIVTDLRSEISRLQHEISLLSDEMATDSGQGTSAQRGQMASLHTDLTTAQRELGKYQARI